MCTLQEFKDANQKEHRAITDKLNLLEPKIEAAGTISKITKWVTGFMMTTIVILLSIITAFSGMTYKSTAHAKEVEINSFMQIKALQDTMATHWNIETKRYTTEIKPQKQWTHKVNDKYIMPTYKRSLRDSVKIEKISRITKQNSKDIVEIKSNFFKLKKLKE